VKYEVKKYQKAQELHTSNYRFSNYSNYMYNTTWCWLHLPFKLIRNVKHYM